MTEEEMQAMMDVMGLTFYHTKYFAEVWIVRSKDLDKYGNRTADAVTWIRSPDSKDKLEVFTSLLEEIDSPLVKKLLG